MIDKIWKFRNKNLRDDIINNVSQEYRIPRVIATILLNRGIESDDISPFLKKSMSDIVNPKLMLDMDKAVERINAAVKNKEKIAVYGDYDVDGITSTALLYEFLSSMGADVEYYIPDRSEGYGMNISALERIINGGTQLIITVDNGISAVEEAQFLKKKGVELIITDHHQPGTELPECASCIDPNRVDDNSPFKELCGAGVALKLLIALEEDKRGGAA